MREKYDAVAVLGAYLTHTTKVAETEQEARDHVENCGWCQNQIEETEQVDRLALAQQKVHSEVRRSQDR